MTGLSKTSIPVAVPAVSRLALDCDHVTTMDFGCMQPVYYRHPIKGEKVDLNAAGTVRPFPLACPTYGRMRLNMHHFFVPWRTVFPQFDHFYNDNIAVNYGNASLVDDAPYFLNSSVVTLYTQNNIYAAPIANWTSGTPYDFYDSSNHYRFTTVGKLFYKVLVSLGYEINWSLKDTIELSALPILAYARIYIDWYANQSYLDSSDVIGIRQMLAYNDPTQPLVLDAAALAVIASMVSAVTYDQDYFVGSWDNPFAPNSGQFSAISWSDIVSGTAVTTNTDGTPYMYQGANTLVGIGSQYLHDALKAITDYSKRHQLAGASNINRALAQYGFGVSHLKADRSYHLGGSSIDIQTGAVFSTANTATGNNPSTLGDFAGNGYGNGVGSFDFKVEELGIVISIASIMPSGGYYQGCDENNMHVKKTDFFVPEFDGLGVQAIRKREVYVSNNGGFGLYNNNIMYDEPFGMTGRYGEYKRPRNWVSGDLRCPTRFNGGEAWHLMRKFSDASFPLGINDLKHSLAFTRLTDKDTYRRILTYTEGDNDPFIAEFHFGVSSLAPCRGIFETYDFETDNNKKVTLEAQGGVLN